MKVSKKKYDEAEKKLKAYYRKKYDELKEENEKLKERTHEINQMKENRTDLEKQLHESKKKMADVLNYAITNNESSLIEEIYSIY